MTNNLPSICRQYVQKKALIDQLGKEADALKAQIIKLHAGRDLITEGGVESKIIRATRSTLQKDAVQELLGYDIPQTCFKTTQYEQLKVKIING